MSGRHPDERSRHDDDVIYSLEELASEADVTPRTVRYYIAEGLLPPPLSPGRNARYTREHLDRLVLITDMKARYMPLKEIRRSINAMSPEQIRRRVARRSGVCAAESRSRPDVSSAQDYLSGVMEDAGSYEASAPRVSRRSRPEHDHHANRSWRRMPITDDAELLITEDALRRRGDQIESALDWIRRILND